MLDMLARRALVTGASGFIGSHLCRRLLRSGFEVHAVSRNLRASHVTRGSADKLTWWEADVADFESVLKIFRQTRPDLVFHLASHVMGAPVVEHVLPTFRGNLQTTVSLLTAAAEFGCRRIILTGSLVESGPERAETTPCSPYAAAKIASSTYGRMFHALYQVPVVIARVFMVYGPGQRDPRKLIPYVTLSLLRGEAPRISSGQRLVDWVYVDDVVEGFVALAETPDIEGCTIDLGSGVLVSIREIVQRLEKLIDSGAPVLYGALPERPMEPVRVANTADAQVKIGWKPAVPLELGLCRTVEWYRERLSIFR